MAASPGFIKEQFENYIRAAYRPRLNNLLEFATGGAGSDLRRRGIDIARRGVVVPAYVVQANEHIWRPGMYSACYCLVLMTFDTARMNDRRFMKGIVRQLNHLKETQQSDPDLAAAANIVTDERAYRDRRQVIPPSLTDGVTVFAADLVLPRVRLEDGYLDAHDLTCIADPGWDGAIELVPWWIAAGHPGVRRQDTALGQLTSRGTAAAAVVIGVTVSAGFVTGSLKPVAAPRPAQAVTTEYATPAYPTPSRPGSTPIPYHESAQPSYGSAQPSSGPREPQVIHATPDEMRRLEPAAPDPYASVRRNLPPGFQLRRGGSPYMPGNPTQSPFGRRYGVNGNSYSPGYQPGPGPQYSPPQPAAGDTSGGDQPSGYQQPPQGGYTPPQQAAPPQYPAAPSDQGDQNGSGQ